MTDDALNDALNDTLGLQINSYQQKLQARLNKQKERRYQMFSDFVANKYHNKTDEIKDSQIHLIMDMYRVFEDKDWFISLTTEKRYYACFDIVLYSIKKKTEQIQEIRTGNKPIINMAKNYLQKVQNYNAEDVVIGSGDKIVDIPHEEI